MRGANPYRILYRASAASLQSTAAAHHSTAMYDYAKIVRLTATVRRFQWINPHCLVQAIAPDESGKEVEWAIETGTPVISARKGLASEKVVCTPAAKAAEK